MSKNTVQMPVAHHDFYKTNGYDATTYFVGPSLTRQEFADECDINVIMSRYEKTGVLPSNGVEPQYVDFTQIPSDLMTTLRMMDEAEAAFMRLPAGVRKEFENNAHLFVDFAADPANLEQMREWGLAEPAPVAPAPAASEGAPAPAPVAAPAAPAAQGAPKAP